jgi:hypothetical protein
MIESTVSYDDRVAGVLGRGNHDLYEHSVVSDATWAVLAKKYSTEQMIDLVFTIGQYNLVSWALNSFGVPLDDYLPVDGGQSARIG